MRSLFGKKKESKVAVDGHSKGGEIDEENPKPVAMMSFFPGSEKEDAKKEQAAKEEEARILRIKQARAKKAAIERAQVVTEVYGEQPFKPGVDPGLKTWIYVREQMRAVESGSIELPRTYPTRIKYKYLTYWEPEVTQPYKDLIAEGYAYQQQRAEERERLAGEEGRDVLERRKRRIEDGEEDENAWEREVLEAEAMEMQDDRLTALKRAEKAEKGALNEAQEEEKEEKEHLVLPPLKGDNPPRFPGWSIERFKNFMEWGDRSEALLVAYYHHHWHYLDMILSGPRGNLLLNDIIVEKSQQTLLHVCVKQGDPERLEYLLRHGANVRAKDIRGDTVLHMCFDHPIYNAFHPTSIAQRLIDAGAQVNEPNKRGVTPLHRAILYNAQDFVEVFLRNKANVFLFDNDNKLPIHYAKDENKQEIKELFGKNLRFGGRPTHRRMWAYIMSRDFVKSIFEVTAPKCVTCKRKQYECDALKNRDFRYWLWSHDLQKKANQKR